MRIKYILFLLLIPLLLNAQDSLTLSACLEEIVAYSPRLRDKELIDDQGKLSMDNIRANWYPQLMLNGKASYQSDVVSIEISDPAFPFSFPDMPHEQFGLNLDVHQTIYDGGLSRRKKQYEQAITASEIQLVNVDMQSLREQVSGLYFSILLLQENRNNLEIAMKSLKTREKTLASAIANGIALETDMMVLNVEVLKILQSLSELDAGRIGALKMLSVYMGRVLKEDILLEHPFMELDTEGNMERPELELLSLQSATLEAGKALASSKRLPQVYAFGQAGVGMPGYNMLNDEIDPYFMVGAGLKWNIWDWNKTKREKQILDKKKLMIENSKETFSMNILAGMEKELENMEHYSNALNLDEKMLEMRMNITKNAASKLDNGTISATDYLLELNEESLSRIKRSTHKLQLMKAIVNYNLLKGTL
jgi:outer membrane protein TolC